MNKQKKAVVLIYVLFLVGLAIVFATILVTNNQHLFNVSEIFNIKSKLSTNIKNDSKILVDINNAYNSNGSGFIDNISCPASSISMSGNTLISNISTQLVNDGNIYCEGTYFGDSVKIYFNTGITDLIEAEYKGYIVSLTGGLGESTFGDSDNTLIDFSSYNYNIADGYDDNFDSDNYKVTSTGTTLSGVYYLDNYIDDDVDGRKEIIGYIDGNGIFKKVFWNTDRFTNIIDQNTNNNDSFNLKLGNVSDGLLNFDISGDLDIKISQFDRTYYNDYNELRLLGSLSGTLLTGTGYLQNNSGVLSLSEIKTGNEYLFDFVNNDYGIFLKSNGTGTISYKISGETISGTGIYIVPIDDSNDSFVSILGNEIIIGDNGEYIAKETELFYKK